MEVGKKSTYYKNLFKTLKYFQNYRHRFTSQTLNSIAFLNLKIIITKCIRRDYLADKFCIIS